MRKEFARVLRDHFTKKVAERLPGFEPFKEKSIYLFPGEQAFFRVAADDLWLFVVCSPDERGHEAGNMALKTAGKIFRQELRPFDIICRYGGEEFAIILPQTNLPIAVNIAERVRVSLEKASVVFEDQVFNVTASFGVAIYEHGSQLFEKTFVEMADKFMYQAKQQGRNQVCHADYSTLMPRTEVTGEEKSELFNRRKDES